MPTTCGFHCSCCGCLLAPRTLSDDWLVDWHQRINRSITVLMGRCRMAFGVFPCCENLYQQLWLYLCMIIRATLVVTHTHSPFSTWYVTWCFTFCRVCSDNTGSASQTNAAWCVLGAVVCEQACAWEDRIPTWRSQRRKRRSPAFSTVIGPSFCASGMCSASANCTAARGG